VDVEARHAAWVALSSGRVVALLGAESTGKTALARDLSQRLADRHGLRCTWVSEWLREWCEREGRSPQREEQAAIAAEQTRRIAAACKDHDIVLADTTALMTAVYSRFLFNDDSLMVQAQSTQRDYAVTLVTANDLPWIPDPNQRDGVHVREPVHDLLMQALRVARIESDPVQGLGSERLDHALAHVRRRLNLY